ncbi:SDR family NAD(P)-dependent oxidoreductase [Mucilaginibacter conchicola]|uniref:SDR family NAD(P)-dependent oxidoreductase n=1 Tax=Mucilaginibacter conchicola TaxID=2303333 RepID=A0A372NY65_9SPHI|nr:SDR family NAD(P)-dependent oxidoreductase [Mucilaginibacter conchicola]RFZ94609.1 SDR family NAD(P)-dependent oxidoreductase [Mucilaginibacter conchicola]
MENNKKIWFVTGASKGLGLTLVKQLLQHGYKVAATSRKLTDLEHAVGTHADFLPLAMNIKNEESVADGIARTIAHFGRVDVVVNNAGYGIAGSLEELTDREARENFDVNVFGSLNVIRSVMPFLREQGTGHIFNVSSIGGFTGNFPGFGIYCATKFAVQGFTESLAAEVKAFGVKATVVSPGYFRTNFLAADSLAVPQNEIAAYKEVRDVQSAHQNEINGNQAGDPVKAAEAMIAVAESDHAPLHLFLGQDAYDLAYQKMGAVTKDLECWRAVSTTTGFAAVEETEEV